MYINKYLFIYLYLCFNRQVKDTKKKIMNASALLSIFVFLIICQTAFCSCPVLYQGIKDHSACVPRSPEFESGSVSDADIKVILDEHNKYRAAVNPPACTMLKLYWNKDLAYVAQKWAENCKFDHDQMLPRSIPGSFTAGQNLGKGFTTWKSCIAAWQNEVKDFTYNGTNELEKVGHYTQLVWATTAMIGCGFAKCKKFPLHVCNYGPSGNNGINRPYEKCNKNSPLKDCKGKFCKNGGLMKSGSCECSCKSYKHIYGPECNVNCSVKDQSPCGSSFKADMCYKYTNVPSTCPWMCKTCPNLDKSTEHKTSPKPTTTQLIETSSVFLRKPTFSPDFSGTTTLKYSVISALPLMVLFLLIMI